MSLADLHKTLVDIDARLAAVATPAKNKKSAAFLAGDAATALDLFIAAHIVCRRTTHLKLAPATTAWLDSIITACV